MKDITSPATLREILADLAYIAIELNKQAYDENADIYDAQIQLQRMIEDNIETAIFRICNILTQDNDNYVKAEDDNGAIEAIPQMQGTREALDSLTIIKK